MKLFSPASDGHFIDPRVRAYVMDCPDVTVIMVHRAKMVAGEGCWLLITAKGARLVAHFTTTGPVESIQLVGGEGLGTVPCAFLTTTSSILVLSEDTIQTWDWDPGEEGEDWHWEGE